MTAWNCARCDALNLPQHNQCQKCQRWRFDMGDPTKSDQENQEALDYCFNGPRPNQPRPFTKLELIMLRRCITHFKMNNQQFLSHDDLEALNSAEQNL